MIPVWFIGGPRTGNSDVEGGNTSAKSGDAYGGDANGGKANANGGDASNNAVVKGSNDSQSSDTCGCESQKPSKFDGFSNYEGGHGSDVDQKNNPDITQGDNSANGGVAEA